MTQLADPADGATLEVVIRSRRQVLELEARGPLDTWTIDALVRDLVDALEPCHTEIHLDLRRVDSLGRASVAGLARCRAFAHSHGARIRISPPSPTLRPQLDLREPPGPGS
jgi:hypothetical protein